MSDTAFRLAGWDDLPAIRLLLQQAFTPLQEILPSRPTALDETIGSLTGHLASGSQIFVAERQGLPVSCLLVLPPDDGCAEVKRVCTHPDWQGHGLGSALMSHAERQLSLQGVQRLKLSTRRRLPDNLRFYQRLGYSQSAIQPYPAGIDDERIELSKTLAAA
ncbi:GNAT family N-acetyltransferase [Chromobacterium vaccinii]|uniref:GNAT family N-acetyltransferase n=1 Tax=Chromobacterium vaccinii TaxID=1108595 RepID=UPI0006983131|nr:GNAT family N-acetyltransferase [Chromobacterium vaccinii]QND86052.1 Acetyltransferase [Chromobacterium vaccinii]QND91283.1 Acetyltransferase [Chromobacterium vaccinii]SUX56461.1 putative acetyltransferase [Chromobacterium vaccinii]